MKPVLYNKVDKKILKRQIVVDTRKRYTYAFYRYIPLVELQTLRDRLYQEFNALGMLGRIYLATEGINAQFSLPSDQQVAFMRLTERYPLLKGIQLQQALEEAAPSFHKLAVKIRTKLVSDGLAPGTIDFTQRGKKLTPAQFEQAMEQKQSLVIDVRNHYEHEVGYFENALRFPADTFRELLPQMAASLKGKEEQQLLMYCTGGIRCEKASAFLKQHGFKHAYQLQGGIIGYVQALRNRKDLDASRFKGKNFVFDNRLGERVNGDILAQCHQCQTPCDVHTNCANEDCHLLFIQCLECCTHFNGCCSYACKAKVALPLVEQRKLRRGKRKKDALMVHKARATLSKIDVREKTSTLETH